MARVLVTGAAGFIGSTVAVLLARHHDVLALDSFDEGLYPAAEKRGRWEELGSTLGVNRVTASLLTDDIARIVSEGKFEYVIHLAAMAGLQKSWTDFSAYVNNNIVATQRLAEALSRGSDAKVINISTSSVYGAHAVGGEQQIPTPVSPYGVTKLAAEGVLNSYSRAANFTVAHLRYFSVYGPGQRPDMAYRKFINAALTGEIVEINGSGDQTRTNTYVFDIARWTVNAIEKASAGQVYNLSGSQSISVNEAITLIEALSGCPIRRIYKPVPPGDQLETQGNPLKARASGIIDQETPISEGLAMQIEWQRSHLLG